MSDKKTFLYASTVSTAMQYSGILRKIAGQTGGMARLVADEVGTIDRLDGILTLKGLRLIYERNR